MSRSYERIVEAWIVALRRACSQGVDILHLNHLTPIHEAALRAFADVPIVTHLHGTELALLERIERGCGHPWGTRAPGLSGCAGGQTHRRG